MHCRIWRSSRFSRKFLSPFSLQLPVYRYYASKSGVQSSMRAVRIHETGGPEVLKLDEKIPTPKNGDKEVLVEVAVSGVNYIDTYHRNGLYSLPLPVIIGREAAGVVASVGKDVKHLAVGDRVAFVSPYSYAEYVSVAADQAHKLPKELDFKNGAASMLQGLTAHYLVTNSYPIKKGDFVLVHAGAGGTGGLLIQMAKIRGATVLTTVSTEEKAKIAKEAGADIVINYTTENFVEAVKKATDGKGVHAVYDGVGKSTWEDSIKSLRKRGFLVLFGNASGPVPPINPLLLTSSGSIFVTRPTLVDHIADPEEAAGRVSELFGWIKDKKVNIRVAAEFELAKAKEAHEFLEGRKALGKILLIVNPKL